MIVLAITLLTSWLLCGIYLRIAQRWQIFDLPNERSSHQLPTPHGAGVPLFIALGIGVVTAAVMGENWPPQYYQLLIIAGCLMLVGVLDDLRGLSVPLRFSIYGLSSLLAVTFIFSPWQDNGTFALLSAALAVAVCIWMLNLYNFMDGIDGYAASQCLAACCGAAGAGLEHRSHL